MITKKECEAIKQELTDNRQNAFIERDLANSSAGTEYSRGYWAGAAYAYGRAIQKLDRFL